MQEMIMEHTVRGSVLQVAHVVRDLDKAMAHWTQSLGAGPFFVAHFKLDGQQYRGKPASLDARIAIGYLGSTNIELVQTNDDAPSVFNEVLTSRGEGLHHYWLAADDLDTEIARYQAAGCPMIGYGEAPGFTRGAFMDTSAILGCYVELQVVTPQILRDMQAVHRAWDGSNPVRPYPSL
jgi:hypothetical protein